MSVSDVHSDLPAPGTPDDALMRHVFDSLDGRIGVLARDGEVFEANCAWDQMAAGTGWAVHGPHGGNLLSRARSLTSDLAGPLAAALDLVLAGGPPMEVKGELPAGQGTERVVVRLRPVHGDRQAAAVVTIVDITGPLHVQQEQRRTADQAQMIALVARHTDSAVVILDAQGRVEWVNEAFSRISEYPVEEVVGRHRSDLVPGPFARSKGFAAFEQALREGSSADLQVPNQSKGGRTYWVQMEIRPITEDGSMAGLFICIERDITNQRSADEQLRAANRHARLLAEELHAEKNLLAEVLGAIPHLVYWKDADLRYAGVNPAFLSLRGLSRPEDVLERTEGELDHSDDLTDVLLDAETAVLLSGQPRENQRVLINSAKEGSGWRSLLLSVLPQTDDDGVIGGVIGVAADVTQLSALEQQLAQASRLESIGQLAAGIAHEINTPVQYVSDNTGFLVSCFREILDALTITRETLENDSDLDAARSALAAIDLDFLAEEIPSALSQSQEGLTRVAQIVRAMKDFSHPGQGRAEADLNQAVRTTIQVCRNEWRYVADVELDLSDAVGLVACYEGELKQVLLNIVVNAAQAIDEQRAQVGRDDLGHILITSRRTAEGVRIVVSDDGPGMDEEVRRRVFDPFFTTKPVGRGTGQGLSMAYAVIAQKHAGNIVVDSAPGQGTSFTIDLPDARPDAPVDDAA
ncbi:PAS domain-containing protein [Kineosporia sp. NBRC 101731]|uniref:PAS domain-containing protein n=1 Tax=Kineosporia sp. NBRC 101731 TaxID=3032199 RepID=UPI0024A3016F|nr:PAS domain-containing protein [Kineosporia sp. NBRC 101731]GLY29068.1 hypothetical protein Kisp02_24330 [Kineosporia sp. NBRC 101731]